jgi:hypothetical protein
MKVRTAFLLLLLVVLVSTGYYLLIYIPKHSKAGEPVLALMNYFLTYAPMQPIGEAAYVLPDSLNVWDTPAEIRMRVATLKSGDQVYALARFRQWTHVRLLNGRDGWVDADGLMAEATHAEDEQLLSEMRDLPVQATGHAADLTHVHIQPSRKAAIVVQVKSNQELAVFGRRVVERPQESTTPGVPSISSNIHEAWYLVRAGSRVGWILGRLVQLDIPKSISAYTQELNLVAWLVLNTVDDNGRQVPQYLVADRVGTETYDYSHIRVLTWWKKKQMYAVAYREGDLQGCFPILVTHEGNLPSFRLRLVDDKGAKYQKVYALFDTVTRVMGTVDGWQSDAMPERPASRLAKVRRRSNRSSQRLILP